MPDSQGSLSFRMRIVGSLAKGALLLPLMVAACKNPQTAGVTAAPYPANALGGTTTTGTAHQGSASPQSEPNTVALDQINTFLLEARTELLAQRDVSSNTAISSDNLREAAPKVPFEALKAAAAPEGAPEPVLVEQIELTEATEVVEQSGADTLAAAQDKLAAADLEKAAGLEAGAEPPATDVISAWIRSLLTSASASDAPLRHHLTVAIVLGMSAPERSFNPEGLSELTEAEQELVRIVYEQFRVLGQDLEMGGDSETVVEVLTGLIELVEAEEPFRIARMNLCSWVRDFGDVDVIDPPTFAPTERPRFIWYVELAGVAPQQDTATGAWLYEFDLRLEMLTRDTGIPVIAPIEGTVRHSASSRINDLFLRDLFDIPADLQFDWYTTKLTITDRQTGVQAQKSHELLWVPNLAAGASHIERRAAVAPAN